MNAPPPANMYGRARGGCPVIAGLLLERHIAGERAIAHAGDMRAQQRAQEKEVRDLQQELREHRMRGFARNMSTQ